MRAPLCFVVLAVIAGAGMPVAAASPNDVSYIGGSASDVVNSLESEGYNVQINWLNGYQPKPLSECWVVGVNNPGDLSLSDNAFVTVYVDVRCPNHDY